MTSVDLQLSQADNCLKKGRPAEAEQLLSAALAADPQNVAALKMLVRAAQLQGKLRETVPLLEKLQEIDGRLPGYDYQLGLAKLNMDAVEAALEHFENADRSDPDQVPVMLYRAVALEKLGRRRDAAVLYKRCWTLRLHNQKVLAALPPFMQQIALRGRAAIADELARSFEEIRSEVRRDFGTADLGKIENVIAIAIGKRRPDPKHPLKSAAGISIPGLAEKPFHDREAFPWIEEVESLTDSIRDEYLALGEDDELFKPYVQKDETLPGAEHWKAVNNSRDWNSCHLYRLGQLNEAAARRCPTTMKALEIAPLMHVPEHGPECIFSVLRPKTHIPPHHGLVEGRLLVHLPLIVPKDCGALRVGGVARSWETGRCLVFDDTFAHEAWNHSKETRVVLIFDVWHPELSAVERAAFARVCQVIDQLKAEAVGKMQQGG